MQDDILQVDESRKAQQIPLSEAFDMMSVDQVRMEKAGTYNVVDDKLTAFVNGTFNADTNYAYERQAGEVYFKASAHDHEVYNRVMKAENEKQWAEHVAANAVEPKDIPADVRQLNEKAALADAAALTLNPDWVNQPTRFEQDTKPEAPPPEVMALYEKEAAAISARNTTEAPDNSQSSASVTQAQAENETAQARDSLRDSAAKEGSSQSKSAFNESAPKSAGPSETESSATASAAESAASPRRRRFEQEGNERTSAEGATRFRRSVSPDENERRSDSGAAVGLEDKRENRKTSGDNFKGNEIERGFAGLKEGGRTRDRLVFTGDEEVLRRFNQTLEAKGLLKMMDGQRTIVASDKTIEKLWKESAAQVNKMRGGTGESEIKSDQIGSIQFKAERVGLIANTIGRLAPATARVNVFTAGTQAQRETQSANFDTFVNTLKQQNLMVEGEGNSVKTGEFLRDAANVALAAGTPGSKAFTDKEAAAEAQANSPAKAAASGDLGARLEAMTRNPALAFETSRRAGEDLPRSNGERATTEFQKELEGGLKSIPLAERANTIAAMAAFSQKITELADSKDGNKAFSAREIAGSLESNKGTRQLQTVLQNGVESVPNFEEKFNAKTAELVRDGALTEKQGLVLKSLMDLAATKATAKALDGNDAVGNINPSAEAPAAKFDQRTAATSEPTGGPRAPASDAATPASGATPTANASTSVDPVLAVAPGELKVGDASATSKAQEAKSESASAAAPSSASAGAESAQTQAQPQGPARGEPAPVDWGNAYSATSGAPTATVGTVPAAGARLVESDPLANFSPGNDRKSEPPTMSELAIASSTGASATAAQAQEVSGVSKAQGASDATHGSTETSGVAPLQSSQTASVSATGVGPQAPAESALKATAQTQAASDYAATPTQDSPKAPQAESLRDRIESIAAAGPQALTQERVTSLMADLEGRRGLNLDRVDNGDGNKPTETLSRLEAVLNFAASGKFDAATSVQAQSLQSELTRWKGQDTERGGSDAAQQGASKEAEQWKAPIAADSASSTETRASHIAKGTHNQEATLTAPAQESAPGKLNNTDSQATSGPNQPQASASTRDATKTEASFSQTAAQVQKLSEAFTNPANKFVTRSDNWNKGKITETAAAVVGLNEKELSRMNPEKITEMAAFAGWLSRSANEGQIPGFAGEKGEALKESLERKAHSLVELASKIGADISPQVEKNIQRGDSLLSSMETHQQLHAAASAYSARESTVSALKHSSPLVEESLKAEATRFNKSEEVDIRAGVKPVQDLAVTTAKESLQAFDGSITEASVKNILKNASTLTPENLQAMDKDSLAKAMVSLEAISSNLRDGSLLGPVDQLSKGMQSNLGNLEKAVDTLNNTLGKSADMTGPLIRAHEGFGKGADQVNQPTEASDTKTKVVGRGAGMEL